MIKVRLEKHLKLCRKNLGDKRVRCCASCPFEDELVSARPEMKKLFMAKRKMLEKT